MKDNFIKTVSKELRIIRIEHNDNQEDLARKSGVSICTISKYETGNQKMNIYKIEEILKPYNISLFIFFNRVRAKTKS